MYDIFELDKRTIKMVHAKIYWLIADVIGIPSTILGILLNLDNIKSTILFIVALIWGMVRIYFHFKDRSQRVREKDIQLWHMEMDKQERESKMDND